MVKYTSHLDEVMKALESGVSEGLDLIGDRAQGYAQNLTPVDTGNLRASLKHEREDKHTEVVGAFNESAPYKKVDYAKFVELGTSRMRAQPFLRPAAENHTREYVKIMKDALGI